MARAASRVSLCSNRWRMKCCRPSVRGISVGVPGIVIDGNRVIAAPAVELDNFLLADRLTPLLPYPIMVENDVNLAALGELWFGYSRQCDDLLYLHIGTLVGLGIILDRCVIRGVHTGAGELGYMLLKQARLSQKLSGVGSLEESIPGSGLGKRAKQALGRKAGTVTVKDLFDYAAHGERWAQDIVHDFTEKLSMVLANLATLFRSRHDRPWRRRDGERVRLSAENPAADSRKNTQPDSHRAHTTWLKHWDSWWLG